MNTRALPAPLIRMIFGLLLVLSLVAPICLWILSARAPDPAGMVSLFHVWSFATALLLIWSAIYIREEPRLARITLYFAILVFAFITFRAGSWSFERLAPSLVIEPTPSATAAAQTNATASSSASSAKGSKIAAVPKTGKLEDDIVGKWKSTNSGGETVLFAKDKTFVTATADGHTVFGRYYFLDPNRLQFFFFHGTSDAPFIYKDLAIKDRTLTRTFSQKKIEYTRLDTYEDSAGVTGFWRAASDGSPLMLFPDGTFVFSPNIAGTWQLDGRQMVCKSNDPAGSTWTFTLSSDGRALSGTWSRPGGKNGTTTLNRPVKLDHLAEYIIGRWQLTGHTQRLEFKEDGTLVQTGDDGGTKTFNYTVPDQNHIQTALPRVPIPLPIWTIEMVSENVLTNKVTAQGAAATYVRIE